MHYAEGLHKNSIKDLQDFYYTGESDFIRDTQERLINHFNIEIDAVER